MKITILSIGLLAFAALCQSAPLEERVETDPELTAGYYEGDIVLDEKNRNGMRNENYRWPNALVIYKFGDNFDDAHRNHILRGMEIISENSCIRFREADSTDKYYVNITGGSGGCFSSVGYLKRVQSYNLQMYPLNEGCFRMGTIIHEFLHTLGFYHMQSSSDRETYVHIAEENVQDGTLHNFNIYSESVVTDFGEKYDYGSVLHYSAYAFSKNGLKTIVAREESDAANNMGQRAGMSQSDINRLNTMYRCPIDV